MKNTDKATPRPWKVAGKVYIAQAGGQEETIAKAIKPHRNMLLKNEETEIVNRANAAYIVKAVNCHEELLEACKLLLQSLTQWVEIQGDEDARESDEVALEKGILAISKAEGKE